MIISYIFSVVLALTIAPTQSISTDQDTKDCARFKTGTFDNIDPEDEIVNTRIIRSERYQLEKYYKYEAECRFKIKWLDECTYELAFDSGNEGCLKIVDPNIKVIVEIVSTSEDSHIAEGWLDGSTQRMRSKLVTVKK
ncbi:MAG: hypothetical protein ABJF11_13075 [Reichenbachiella sp.]|uniref:hypothetical protein n=1 Tax=Reichenbachiella sp. TaxID=2184521 RepID=UPI0032669FC0